MGTVVEPIPRFVTSDEASSIEPVEEKRDGINTPCTRAGPRASAAIVATSEESTPPDKPTSTSVKPFLQT